MSTTIQVSDNIRDRLANMRLSGRETYNDVIERLIEDIEELDANTKRDIERARKQIENGEYKTHEEVRAELGL